MKCFFHKSDLDGHCSGALIKLKYPECEMIGINYGDEWVWDVQLDEVVFMVDFCLQPFSKMDKLSLVCELIWIDHHKTAIDAYHDSDLFMENNYIIGLRCVGVGACALVWEYLYATQVPYPVQLLADYDVWNHEDPHTLPFQYGLRLEDTDPSTEKGMITWSHILKLNSDITMVVENGYIVLSYEKQSNALYAKNAFETIFEGQRCIVINKLMTNSKLFDSVWDPEKYDMMVAFGWRGKHWTVSLYTTKNDVDVSIIAKKHGGGGHAGAAGFNVTNYLWLNGKKSPLCFIYGAESAASFEKHCELNKLKETCQDIWNHPSKYSKYPDRSEDAYYKFLKLLWVRTPIDNKDIQLAAIAQGGDRLI